MAKKDDSKHAGTKIESRERRYFMMTFSDSCIDTYEELEPLYIQFKEKYHCIFQTEIYSGEQWSEIIPKCRPCRRQFRAKEATRLLILKLGIDILKYKDM